MKLQAEYWNAKYEGTRTTAPLTAYDAGIDAGYISLLWLITGEYYADSYSNGVFGRIRPRNNFSMEQDGGWGAWEVGLRYSYLRCQRFSGRGHRRGQYRTRRDHRNRRVAATPTAEADAWTLGLKWMANPVHAPDGQLYGDPFRYADRRQWHRHG